MATPFSQLVGIQALLNVVQGERYQTIPDENLMYLAGWYGDPPGEVDPELLDRAGATDRGRAILAEDEAPQPTLKEIRAQYGESLSDEELLLRYLIPGPDVDAMYAATQPVRPIFPIGGPHGLAQNIETRLISCSAVGFTTVPLYSIVFLCRATGGDLAAHPLETSDVGFFAQDALPSPVAGYEQWGDTAYRALRGEDVPVHFDDVRAEIWRT